MSGIWKRIKPAAGLLVLCGIALLAQAACGLALPAVLGELVTRGVQQGGLEAGAPEAVSWQGMTLLQTFLSEEDRELLGDQYFTIRPGSTEADRLAQEYPLVRERTVCVRREGMTVAETAALDRAYATAADALTRYLERAAETGELTETARRFSEGQKKDPGAFRSNVRDLTPAESDLPQGVLGKIPADALFTMPGKESAAPEAEAESGPAAPAPEASEVPEEMEPPEQTPAPENTPAAPDLDLTGDIAGMDADRLYTLLPLLAQTTRSSVADAVAQAEAAAESQPDRGPRLGIPLKAMLYRELGLRVEELRRGAVWTGLWKLLGLTLLELLLAGAAWLLGARAAARIGRDLRREMAARGETVTGRARQAERLVRRLPRGVGYALGMLLGGAALGWRSRVTAGETAVLLLAGLLALGLAAGSLWGLPPLEALRRRGDALCRRLGPWEDLPAALLISAGLLGMNVLCVAFALADSRRIANAVLPVGSRMAALEYAGLMLLAGILLAGTLGRLPRRPQGKEGKR